MRNIKKLFLPHAAPTTERPTAIQDPIKAHIYGDVSVRKAPTLNSSPFPVNNKSKKMTNAPRARI